MHQRSAVPFLPIVFLTLSCSAPNREQVPESFDANVHIAAWVELWNTRDLDRLDELFLDDSRVTYFSSEYEGLIKGPAAVREHHEGFGFVAGGAEAEQQLWVEDVQSSVFGSTAVVTAVWLFGDRTAPPDSVQRGPMTIVYTWTDDRYRIAHIHFANYEPNS
jgi:ketosteroid isomerase-like protein